MDDYKPGLSLDLLVESSVRTGRVGAWSESFHDAGWLMDHLRGRGFVVTVKADGLRGLWARPYTSEAWGPPNRRWAFHGDSFPHVVALAAVWLCGGDKPLSGPA